MKQVIITIPDHVIQSCNHVKELRSKEDKSLPEQAELFEVLDWLSFDSEETSHEMYHLAEEITRQIPIRTPPDKMTVFLRRIDTNKIMPFKLIKPIRTMTHEEIAQMISTATGLPFEFVRTEES